MEPPSKKLKLSLERPYKTDDGDHIPVLLDITPDGHHIYEPRDDPSKTLGARLTRILVERGVDFYDKNQGKSLEDGVLVWTTAQVAQDGEDEEATTTEPTDQPMTPEELFKMRMEILPQLYTAMGEMSHAKELLSLLLAHPNQPSPISSLPSSTLSTTLVSKPPPIPSVQAFNAQLAVGSKDEALRKAADIFKDAAGSMERGRVKGERYWVDALKIRRGNWGLVPAPLPFGSVQLGKGGDKTSKDFLISFGLEESPPHIRRRAIAHLSTSALTPSLVFPHRQRTRLRVSLSTPTTDSFNTIVSADDDDSLDSALRAAQQEVVEQEIFGMLIREAGNLPTASARVSERLIVIEAAQGVELRFELVDDEGYPAPQTGSPETAAKCDLITSILHAFLLRTHTYIKTQRLGTTGVLRTPSGPPGFIRHPPPILQPIIDLLQYGVFCERVEGELGKAVKALGKAGVEGKLRFSAVGEGGSALVSLLNEDGVQRVGGEAVLRMDGRHNVRLTFLSPSSLTAHLPQATLPLSSIPQLVQLLSDEMEQCLLNRICEVGSDVCDRVNGTWFVDMLSARSVGRWEGCVLNFKVRFGEDYGICCSAFRLDHGRNGQQTLSETYSTESTVDLLEWVRETIAKTLSVL